MIKKAPVTFTLLVLIFSCLGSGLLYWLFNWGMWNVLQMKDASITALQNRAVMLQEQLTQSAATATPAQNIDKEKISEREQIRGWLNDNRIRIDEEFDFQIVVSDAEDNPVEIYKLRHDSLNRNESIITISSAMAICNAKDVKVLDAMTKERRLQLKNELEMELLRTNLEFDGRMFPNWNLSVIKHVQFDKTVTKQKFFEQMELVNQGIQLIKKVLDRNLK